MRFRLHIIIPLLMIIIGFLLRLWLYVVMDTHTTDGIAYLSTAEFFRDSSGWQDLPARVRVPLYPFLVFLGELITSADFAIVGRVINFLIGLSMIPFAFLIARKFFSVRAGYLAAYLIAIDCVLIEHSTLDRADLLFTLLSLLLIYFFWIIPWEKCDIKHGLFFGLLMGLTQLTRTNGIFYFLIFIILWFVYLKKHSFSLKKMLMGTLLPVFLVFFILSSLPFLYAKSRNAPFPSYLGHAFVDGTLDALGDREGDWFRLNDDSTEFEKVEMVRSFNISDMVNWDIIVAKYDYGWNFIFGHFFEDTWDYFLNWLPLFFVLLLILLYKFRSIKAWNVAGYMLLFCLPYVLILPYIQVQETYLLPMRPILLILLAWCVTEVTYVLELKRFRWVVAGLLLLGVLMTNTENLFILRDKEALNVNGYIYVGKYLAEIGKPGDSLMASSNTLYLYSKMRGYGLPANTLDKVFDFCIYRDIDYFVYGPAERHRRGAWASEIKELIKSGEISFELIHTESRGGPIQVYKINPPDNQNNFSPLNKTENPYI